MQPSLWDLPTSFGRVTDLQPRRDRAVQHYEPFAGYGTFIELGSRMTSRPGSPKARDKLSTAKAQGLVLTLENFTLLISEIWRQVLSRFATRDSFVFVQW